jgi:hypothetical protein
MPISSRMENSSRTQFFRKRSSSFCNCSKNGSPDCETSLGLPAPRVEPVWPEPPPRTFSYAGAKSRFWSLGRLRRQLNQPVTDTAIPGHLPVPGVALLRNLFIPPKHFSISGLGQCFCPRIGGGLFSASGQTCGTVAGTILPRAASWIASKQLESRARSERQKRLSMFLSKYKPFRAFPHLYG